MQSKPPFSFSCNRNLSQVLRPVRSPQEPASVASPKTSSVAIRHQNIGNASQPKSPGLSLRNQDDVKKSKQEDKTAHVKEVLDGENEGLHSLQKGVKDKARTVTAKDSWSQTDSPPLRDQFTQVEEEEQQGRVARWLACRVVEESLREVVEEEEERGVRRTEKEEEGRGLGNIIKGSFSKEEETIGARKVKWSGNMW